MKKPEVYRKMYTGAEMYRNERQERLSQQMDKLNSDFIKMLYAGGKWDTMQNHKTRISKLNFELVF